MRSFWLACLVPWMAAAAYGAPHGVPGASPVDVDFGYRGVISGDALRVDDKCYVSLEFLRKVDWDPEIQGSEVRIHDDGRTLNLPLFSIAGRRLVSLNDVAKSLEAKAYFPQNSDTFMFKAAVLEAGPTATGVQIRTSNKVRPMVTLQGDRLTIDLKGADYDPATAANLPAGWKMAYTSIDTVRLSIEHPSLSDFSTPKLSETRTIRMALPEAAVTTALRNLRYSDPAPSRGGQTSRSQGDLLPQTQPTAQPLPVPQYQPSSASKFPPLEEPRFAPVSNPGKVDVSMGAVAGEVTLSSDERDRLGLNVFVQNLTPGNIVASYKGANQVQVVFKGAVWRREGELGLSTKLAKSITRTVVNGSAALSIVTEVPLVFNVSSSADGIGIRLTRPQFKGGLNRKVIVIDPGHGGRDNGANYGSLFEKNMTLKYGLALASRLQREGVSVIMTRSDDSYPSLTRRWQLANESGADAFISIHINSLDYNAPQASMTFYHGTSGISQLLAECIQAELANACSIPSWGTQSDFKRFREGMAVLKTNQSPAVLMELGFINNPHDRAEMLSDTYPDRLAEAILRGLKKFFGARD